MKFLSIILTLFYFSRPTHSYFKNDIINSNTIENIILRPGNHLFLTSEVNEDSKEFFINGNTDLNTKNIYVYISSNGGSVLDGNDIVENIKYLKMRNYNVTCIAKKAYSMAFHIFQHCTKRYVTSTSTLMQHQMSLGIHGNYENIKSYLEMIDDINNEFIKHSAIRMKMSPSYFKHKIMNDWWFYGKTAIKHNVADKIVTVGCDKSLYNIKYMKKKRKMGFEELFSGNNNDYIELNGCPLLH